MLWSERLIFCNKHRETKGKYSFYAKEKAFPDTDPKKPETENIRIPEIPLISTPAGIH